jgi:RND superfamily putative drug exporter
MTLVPAFMALLGTRMWWLPRWLDRLLPNLDVEGESLSLSSSHGQDTGQEPDLVSPGR